MKLSLEIPKMRAILQFKIFKIFNFLGEQKGILQIIKKSHGTALRESTLRVNDAPRVALKIRPTTTLRFRQDKIQLCAVNQSKSPKMLLNRRLCKRNWWKSSWPNGTFRLGQWVYRGECIAATRYRRRRINYSAADERSESMASSSLPPVSL